MKDTTIAVGLAKNVFEIAISREAGKVSLNVRHRVVSPARIAERTAFLEIRLKL